MTLRERVQVLAVILAVVVCLVAQVATLEACNATPAQVVTDLTTALDLTQAACSVADTTGNDVVVFACSIATTLENGAIQIANLFVPIPAAGCAPFAAAHPESTTSKALVAVWAKTHPSASTALKWGVGTAR